VKDNIKRELFFIRKKRTPSGDWWKDVFGVIRTIGSLIDSIPPAVFQNWWFYHTVLFYTAWNETK